MTEVPLALVGCDYLIAGTRQRACLALGDEARRELAAMLRALEPGAGLLVLETCNRVEWIVETEEPRWMSELLAARMRDLWERAGSPPPLPEPYRHHREGAVDHVLRVVAGLESLSAGEAQIAGQFQRALTVAVEEATAGPLTRNLGSVAGRVAKAATKLGWRSGSRRGMHALAAEYLDPWVRTGDTVVVVGMGEIGRRVASRLETGGWSVIRMNRTVDGRHRGAWRPLAGLYTAAAGARAIVLATGAERPVLDLERLHPPEGRELLVLDLGVPPQAGGRPAEGVRYTGIDELVRASTAAAEIPALGPLNLEIEREKARFRRYAAARRMVGLLDGLRRRQLRYLDETLPQRIGAALGDLDQPDRDRVLALARSLIREYAGGVYSSIYESVVGADRGAR